MKTSISELLAGKLRTIADCIAPAQTDSVTITSEIVREIHRADGTVELAKFKNVPVYKGLNRIAFRATTYTGTVAAYLVVGTQTAAHSLGSVQGGVGEVIRKISAATVQSQDWFALTCTLGGASDSLTGVALATVGMSDYVNSHATNDNFFGLSNSLNTTLQGSDTVLITYRMRVGSHNLGHSS